MKPRNILRLLFVASLIVPAACGVKDPIFNTAHPSHGTVTLTTDWSRIGEGLTAPGSYTVTAGDYSATLTGVTNRLDHLFAPGKYHLCVYNTADQITVAGTTATLTEATGNVQGAGRFVNAAPGWLFAAAPNMQIIADAEHSLTATMLQQVRQLTLMIEPKGSTADRIDHIEGYLTGAASTLDLANDTHAEPRNVELQFSRITTGVHAGKWSATVRLLGTAGPDQKLNVSIHYADGTPGPLSVDSDLTASLADFNTGKRTPLTLDGGIVEIHTEAGFTATITDWKPVSGGPVVAD